MPGRQLKVVVAGHSNLTWSESGPERSAVALLQARLAEAMPDRECEVVPVLAPITRGLTDRALRAVEEVRPEVVVLTFLGTGFAFDYVTNRIRRKWHRAYAPAARLASTLKALAKDTTDASGARGRAYRLVDALAFALIGGEPFMPLERAAEQAIDTIDELSRREEVEILCRLPGITDGLGGKRYGSYAGRVDAFNSKVAQHCERRRVRAFRIDDALAELEGRPRYAADGVHLDLNTRRLEAIATAYRIKSALAGERFEVGAGETYSLT